ncbi:S8 family serine peptidase [Actinosynnema sp. CA-248983]
MLTSVPRDLPQFGCPQRRRPGWPPPTRATRSGTYTYDKTGAGVHVHVLDTGVRISHQEFGGRAVNGWDAVGRDGVARDRNGHGTHVAGTIGGKTRGVAKAALRPLAGPAPTRRPCAHSPALRPLAGPGPRRTDVVSASCSSDTGTTTVGSGGRRRGRDELVHLPFRVIQPPGQIVVDGTSPAIRVERVPQQEVKPRGEGRDN